MIFGKEKLAWYLYFGSMLKKCAKSLPLYVEKLMDTGQ